MKINERKVSMYTAIVILIFGMGMSAFMTSRFYNKKVNDAVVITNLAAVAFLEDEALRALKEKDTTDVISILKLLTRFLKANLGLDMPLYSKDLALAHGRLSLVHSGLGNQNEAKDNLNQALSYVENLNWNEEKLFEVIRALDAIHRILIYSQPKIKHSK